MTERANEAAAASDDAGRPGAAEQPFRYPLEQPFEEPDWRRIPGWKNVSREEWEDSVFQRKNSVKSLKQLKDTLGDLLPDDLVESIKRDQAERATMAMLIPAQMINTMNTDDLWNCPVRRYMAPAFDDRRQDWPSHPMASRDSLHESEMWAVEGLTHRYPTKVLAEILETCPQYCGHCTRMDLVGGNTPQIEKTRFHVKQKDRWEQMYDYLRENPTVRDVVISGGDIANLPIKRLEDFCTKVIEIPNIKDLRLATKGLMGIPQHFLQDDVRAGMERIAKKAREHEVDIAIHTHVNNARQVTPLVARAARDLLDMGYRDVRNQGVLLRGVNTTAKDLLELCFRLLDDAHIMPYYFYTCDMIPNSEHWRTAIWEDQKLQHDIMGYLPGFATPRIVCDVPYVGKRWVHQVEDYDREKGISYWTKNYRTSIEKDDPDALTRTYPYYDPIYTLPEAGQKYWQQEGSNGG